MKFKIGVIVLFLSCKLQAGEFDHHPDTLNIDEQFSNHVKLREDRWRYLMLNSVKELDNSAIDRNQFHKIRETGRKICEDASDCDDLKNLLDDFDRYHKWGQYVSDKALDERRIALKQMYNKKIDAENSKNREQNSRNSIVSGSAPSAPTAVATAYFVAGNNGSSNSIHNAK